MPVGLRSTLRGSPDTPDDTPNLEDTVTAMPNIADPDRFELLELDNYRSTRTAEPAEDDAAARFDLIEMDPLPAAPVTRTEQAQEMLVEAPQLQDDVVPEFEFGAPPDELTGIAAESAANAAAPNSGAFGSVRTVTAANAVAGHVASYGTDHSDSGANLGIFARPAAERRFIVGESANESANEVIRAGKLEAGQVVAGAVAEGHGVLVGWRGDRQITRAVLLEALTGIGREAWAPKPKDARAQAGRAMAAAGSSYHIKADRKTGAITRNEGGNTSGRHTWRIGEINVMGRPGDNYGRTVAVMTLSPEGELGGNGDTDVIGRIVGDYTSRCAQELYTSADLTSWLATALSTHCGAVNYAVGWYIPAKHRDAAIALCNAVSKTGWGSDWLGSVERPALPIATCDELRAGIARGLKDEVAQVLGKLHAEREAAQAEKARRVAAADALVDPKAKLEAQAALNKLAGDIGPTRAGSFLKELRSIAVRVAAYSELLGEERCGSARRAVHEAVLELEGLLDESNSGLVQRFNLIFDEIQDDLRREGGVL